MNNTTNYSGYSIVMTGILKMDEPCHCRSMSGVHLMKFGHYRTLSRGSLKDFTVATPEEFVKKFGGDRVINKVCFTYFKAQNVHIYVKLAVVLHLQRENISCTGTDSQQWHCCSQMYPFHTTLVV